MINTELKKILETKYASFNLLDKPVPFDVLMKDKDFKFIQVYSTKIVDGGNDIVGFCGEFSWIDNKLEPLDGDSYNPHMTVYGYEKWSCNLIQEGLNILVGDDW